MIEPVEARQAEQTCFILIIRNNMLCLGDIRPASEHPAVLRPAAGGQAAGEAPAGAGRQEGGAGGRGGQVSCDWWRPGHVTPCSSLIGQGGVQEAAETGPGQPAEETLGVTNWLHYRLRY